MENKNKTALKISILVLTFLSLFSFISAVDFTPQGDINLRGVYQIKNATNITAEYYCNSTSCYEINDFLTGGAAYSAGSNLTLIGDVFALNTTGVLEWLDKIYCLLTGCTMTGDLDMGNNDILDVNQINISNRTYVHSLCSSDGNSIYVRPTCDEDDFFTFKTPLDRPTIKREGGKFIYFESSNVYDVGISFRKDTTYSGTLAYAKDDLIFKLLGKASPIAIVPNSEYLNYILFRTFDNQPEISVHNGTKLIINDSLEVIGSINSTGWGNVTITESQISDLQTYLTNLVDDTTPQLGGNLDAQDENITSIDCLTFTSGGKICSGS